MANYIKVHAIRFGTINIIKKNILIRLKYINMLTLGTYVLFGAWMWM